MSRPPTPRSLAHLTGAIQARLAPATPTLPTPLAHREAHARRHALLAQAVQRGVPRMRPLLEVVLTEPVAVTPALAAFGEALAWRAGRSTGDAREPLVRVVGGVPGTGKSCGMARVVARHERSAHFVDAREVATTPQDGWSHHEARWATWLSVDLLGLDDLGTEPGDACILRTLLEQRYNAGRATLVTTNLTRADLVARYADGRLVDRLVHGQAPCPWFVLVRGDSLRRAATRAAFTHAAGSPRAPEPP
jgi:hypothetical protein